jgi:hypothetical protein
VWTRSCCRERSAVVWFLSEESAFVGPHIEEAMVTVCFWVVGESVDRQAGGLFLVM